MPKLSAGIVAFRTTVQLEILLVHPGGPFWANKDIGVWSIPKGEYNLGENPLLAARREFYEELGSTVEGSFFELLPVKQKGGKTVHAWAIEADLDPDKIKSNLFEMEWPPKSGRKRMFPEVDKAAWFSTENARLKIIPQQIPLINQVEELFKGRS